MCDSHWTIHFILILLKLKVIFKNNVAVTIRWQIELVSEFVSQLNSDTVQRILFKDTSAERKRNFLSGLVKNIGPEFHVSWDVA